MGAVNTVTDLTLEGDVAVLTVNYPPVNALSAAVRDGMMEGLSQALQAPEAKALVIICEGRTFFAGADITEFGKPITGVGLRVLSAAIEDATKPVIAAIHGTALGGGLELALCCHYRVALPSAKCGLPEVKIGLLPGAGGTQRLPRLVGVEKALELVTSGDHVPAPACLDIGLVDALIEHGSLREGAVAFARKIVAEGRPLRKAREANEKIDAARAQPNLFTAFRAANARKFRGYTAPEHNIRCVEAAVRLPFDEAMEVERQLFAELMAGPQSQALRYGFFAEREALKIPDIGADSPRLPVKRVGVIGAGTMGGGIAMNFANAGYAVTIVEQAQAALDRGLGIIRKNYDSSAKRGRLSAGDVTERMALIEGALSLDALAECDLIIEAVFENMEVKKSIFTRLDQIAKPGAILATNTSALDINEIAAVTKRPESVIGLHFFSPANVMRLLEIVRAAKTSKPVIATAMDIAKKIGKVGVLVGVCHGFVGNRILFQRQREANTLVMEGAMPWDVDRVLYDFGFPMGPFAMSDLAGLDIGWSKEKSRSATVRDVLCEHGRLGQKTGAGFYDYDSERHKTPSPVTEQIINDFVAKSGANRRPISDEEILERCVFPMINEGARILEENIATRASDIDVVWLHGYGWPPYRGGPMFYGDQIGLVHVLARLQQWEKELGPQFKPARLLERCVAEGKRLQDV
jgi:3-hydroxyacyl-CoA dehydrogenase